jgi:hypothetical protein
VTVLKTKSISFVLLQILVSEKTSTTDLTDFQYVHRSDDVNQAQCFGSGMVYYLSRSYGTFEVIPAWDPDPTS